MQFNTEVIGQHAIILNMNIKTLDLSNASEFKQSVLEAIKGKQTVMIGMDSLEFLDSSGLGTLLSILRNVKKDNGDLKLFGLTRPVQALFELVRMHRVFAIYNNQEEAIASL